MNLLSYRILSVFITFITTASIYIAVAPLQFAHADPTLEKKVYWVVADPKINGLRWGEFQSPADACAAGIALKQEMNANIEGMKWRVNPDKPFYVGGPYISANLGLQPTDPNFNPGNYDIWCNHEYNCSNCSGANWTFEGWYTFWPHSGATVSMNYNEGCVSPKVWNSETFTCESGDPVNAGGCNGKNEGGSASCGSESGIGASKTPSGIASAISSWVKSGGDPMTASNPVNVTSGNKFQFEYDYSSGSLFFRRAYNSLYGSSTKLGYKWLHNYSSSIIRIDETQVLLRRSDGKQFHYMYDSTDGQWKSNDVDGKLTKNGTQWTYTTKHDTQEQYDDLGNLTSIVNINGRTVTLNYDPTGVLTDINDDIGNQISFSYDSRSRISQITIPGNRFINYEYDQNDNLVKVIYPDATPSDPNDNPSKIYHYDNNNRLTGITDERGIRFATYEYDIEGRATASYHAGDVDRVDIQYVDDTHVDVTNSRGFVTNYTIADVAGYSVVAELAGPGCATCGTANTAFTHDSNTAKLTSKTENGLTTQYGNYDSNGNPGFIIEGVGTSQERRTDYTYDPNFRNRIATITESSINSGQNKVTTYTYVNFGNRTSVNVSGFAPDLLGGFVSTSRSINFKFEGPLNQLSEIDGPRPNSSVNDIVQLIYYANNSLEGFNRGRLKQILGPEGIVLRDNIQYTETGRIASELRPNGVSLAYTYYVGSDQLETVTETAGGLSRTTRWTYLPTGEVQTITQALGAPIETSITLGYDDARRLTSITDALGNRIVYTIDTEGNRTNEKIEDSNGVLYRTLQQTFDAYNRLDTRTLVDEIIDYNFSPDGTLGDQSDAKNINTQYTYDELRRLTGVTGDVGGSDTSTQDTLTQYFYDVADRLIQVTAPNGSSTSYVYDDLGNLLKESSPDRGDRIYTYDEAGNVKTITDARGISATYNYDGLNRVTAIDYPGTAEDITFTYDVCTNGIGRLCQIVDQSGTTTYSYSPFGNLEDQVKVEAGVSYTTSYEYDLLGRMTRMITPTGRAIDYHYNTISQISAIDAEVNGISETILHNAQYRADSLIDNLTFGNGFLADFGYSMKGRLTSLVMPAVTPLLVNANNDNASTNYGRSVTIPVLQNDTVADPVNAVISIFAPATYGSATVNQDNTLEYSPMYGFVGIDTVVYEVSLNGAVDYAAVQIQVIDFDTDGDGELDSVDSDDDNDGMPDAWEYGYGLDYLDASNATMDTDGDGFTDLTEYQLGTDPTQAPSQYMQAVLDANPLAYWPLDEGNGSLVAHDFTSGANHMSVIGGPQFMLPGIDNRSAVSTDGVDDQLITSQTIISNNSAVTVEAWFKIDGTSQTAQILRGRDIFGTGWSVALELHHNRMKFGVVTMSAGLQGIFAEYLLTTEMNKWYHLVGTWDPGVGLSLWADGVLIANTSTSTTQLRDDNYGWHIGTASAPGYKMGSVDDVSIYSYVFTQAQVLAHYNASAASLGNSTDTDGDGIWDVLDTDDDNDGMLDAWETTYGLNPLDASDAILDIDGDGLSNLDEHNRQTNPLEKEKQRYFVVDPGFAGGPLEVVSLKDNTTITAGSTTLLLNRFQHGAIPASELQPGTVITGDAAFDVASDVVLTDMLVPEQFMGTAFVNPHNRNTHTYHLLSPDSAANVTIDIGGAITNLVLTQGAVTSFGAGSDNTLSAVITSDVPILVSHTTINNDAYSVPPATTEVVGVRSTLVDVGAVEDNTQVTVYAQDGSSQTTTINKGGKFTPTISTSDSQGQGSAYRIMADKPIGAIQVADGDGGEATSFWSPSHFATEYAFPIDTQYVSVICLRYAIITLTDPVNGVETKLCGGTTAIPGKVYFGSATNGVNISANSTLESNAPVYVIYEGVANNAEKNLLGNELVTVAESTQPEVSGEYVTWTDMKNVSLNGSTLFKSGGLQVGWDAGAASTQTIQGDGAVEFKMPAISGNSVMLGFSNSNPNASFSSIKYAIWAEQTGNVRVFESGVQKGIFTAYSVGDTLRVEREGTTIRYLHNGNVIYVSTTPSTGSLLVDTSMAYINTTAVTDVKIYDGLTTTAGLTDTNSADQSVLLAGSHMNEGYLKVGQAVKPKQVVQNEASQLLVVSSVHTGDTRYDVYRKGPETDHQWQQTAEDPNAYDRPDNVIYLTERTFDAWRTANGNNNRVEHYAHNEHSFISRVADYMLRSPYRADDSGAFVRVDHGTPSNPVSIDSELWTYAYDANGNITSVINNQGERIIGYDNLNRLTTDQRPVGTDDSYDYDRNGNRNAYTVDGALSSYGYLPNSNQLNSDPVGTVTHDAAGNRTSDKNGNRTFEYNNAGRLYKLYESGQLVATYTYNAQGQRTRKVTTSGSTVYHYDLGGNLVSETDGNGTALRDYVYMNSVPVAQIDTNSGSDTVNYLHTDHLGTPRRATNATGDVVWSWDSDAFGTTAPVQDPDNDGMATIINLRFAGQYYDAESGLHYNYFRYYDPSTGRYVTSDPIGLMGGLNTYGYVGGNPLLWIDPLGLYTEIIIWQPIGRGSSSFGHVSSNINGRNYSWGPGGWDKTYPNAADYIKRQQKFRSGAGVVLKLTPEQERKLEQCYAKDRGDYSFMSNNCGDPHKDCLSKVLGVEISDSIFPVNIGNDLLDSPYYDGSTFYEGPRRKFWDDGFWAR